MKCAKAECNQETSGKSKYCQEHKREARERFYQMIQEKYQEKDQREADYQRIYQEAYEAGRQAGNGHAPQPMTVIDKQTAQQWYVSEGMCGFAWIIVKDRKFGNWLVKNGYGRRDSYNHGVNIWISEYSQSYERKVEHARAMAHVFDKNMIRCYAGSRLD